MLLTMHRQFMLHCLVVGGDIASRHFELVPLSSGAQKLACWSNREFKHSVSHTFHIHNGLMLSCESSAL